ncbi:MAG: hypothetical protein V3T05_14035 [Myxococcota bacterium]
MRAVAAAILCVAAVGCGGSDSVPPAVSIALFSDGSHACAGVVRMKVTIDVGNKSADSIESEVPTAIAPEQLDCNFDVGVAEALYSLMVGEIKTDIVHTAKVELFDSTDFMVGRGRSGPFRAASHESIDPVEIELVRFAPLGTVLIDLMAEPDFAGARGTLDIVVFAGSEPIGSREIVWPGNAADKRPLRISGLLGIGLRMSLEVTNSAGTSLASRFTKTFALGSSTSDAFASPDLEPM